MTIFYSIAFFIFGTVFGSFFNVVGDRIPAGKSIVFPGSHCTKCNHELTPSELIPIISYIMQGGKCKKCHTKIPIVHPLFELVSGIMFALCYLKFGLTAELIIPLTLISMLLIIIVSDFEYMIIPDEILITFGTLLCFEIFILNGLNGLVLSLLDAGIAFTAMYTVKLFGDFIFKQESMGGGDIKLLFFFGLCLGWPNAIFTIFIGSLIGFPISLIIMALKKTNIIPFGPFLAMGAAIILITGFDANIFLSMLIH